MFVCLFLGLAVGWSFRQSSVARQAQEASEQWRRDIDLISARESDLGELLADPRTCIARLGASVDAGSPVIATVFWNGDRHDGVLFCRQLEPLPAKRSYGLWALDGSRATLAANFLPTVGQTIYPFRCDVPWAAHAVVELTSGPDDGTPDAAGVNVLSRGRLQAAGGS